MDNTYMMSFDTFDCISDYTQIKESNTIINLYKNRNIYFESSGSINLLEIHQRINKLIIPMGYIEYYQFKLNNLYEYFYKNGKHHIIWQITNNCIQIITENKNYDERRNRKLGISLL